MFKEDFAIGELDARKPLEPSNCQKGMMDKNKSGIESGPEKGRGSDHLLTARDKAQDGM